MVVNVVLGVREREGKAAGWVEEEKKKAEERAQRQGCHACPHETQEGGRGGGEEPSQHNNAAAHTRTRGGGRTHARTHTHKTRKKKTAGKWEQGAYHDVLMG